jgi:hypothetical protein
MISLLTVLGPRYGADFHQLDSLAEGPHWPPDSQEAEIGMLVVETIAKIGRAYFSLGKPKKEICRNMHVSRKVVWTMIRSDAAEFHYERSTQPLLAAAIGKQDALFARRYVVSHCVANGRALPPRTVSMVDFEPRFRLTSVPKDFRLLRS